MPLDDERNILKIGPAEWPRREITPLMVEAVRQRIKDAGGTLTVWAVLHEDKWETSFGDGFYLHVHGVALNGDDARQLAALATNTEWDKWHVKIYKLGLNNDVPAFLTTRPDSDEFWIADFVVLLAEIPPGGTASRLNLGKRLREEGPYVSLPEK